MEEWELHKIFSIFSKNELVIAIKERFYNQDEDFDKEGIESLINELREYLKENS
jgi:hypothetical protein